MDQDGYSRLHRKMNPVAPEIQKKIAFTRHHWFLLAGIVIIGMLLRFYGLNWGLPDRTDLHPDEHDYVVQRALSVSWQKPDPEFINYPSFLCYSTALLHGGMKWLNPDRPDWKAYRSGRTISAVYGTLTILVVFFLARRLDGSIYGPLIAAFWTAILPLHVWDSHVAVTDVMMTFWIMLTLLVSIRLVEEPRPNLAALAGLCLGLATGSKYTAAITCVAPLVAVILARASWGRRIRLLLIAAACALAACFIVTPFSFIRFGDTLKALAYEYTHTHGNHLGFSVPADGIQYHRFLYQVMAAWPFSFGLPLYLAAVWGTIRFFRQPGRHKWVILAFAGTFFLLTGSMTLTPLRYYIPLVVLGALFAGLWLGSEISQPFSSWRRRTGLVITVAIAAYTLPFTVSTTWRYPHDTRIAADQWLKTHLQQGQVVHIFGWKRYGGYLTGTGHVMRQHRETALATIDSIGMNEMIEISSLQYLRWQRHGIKDYVAIYDHLRHNPESFELVAKFDRPFLNRDFYGWLDPMFRSYFVAPTIEFYRHKNADIVLSPDLQVGKK